MIRALVVDDEKLARKGFIAMVPWEQFQIDIIGEAANGKIALEFMQQHEVDLLFVDLTMPIMSGLELMKAVGERFPSARMVVLTCHQDFDYIQEALRLGAVDYIVKTQLDTENFEEIFTRIVNRYHNEKVHVSSAARTLHQKAVHYSLLVDVSACAGQSNAFPRELNKTEHVFEIVGGTWLFRMESGHVFDSDIRPFIANHENWIWADIEQINEESVTEICRAVCAIAPKQIYYGFQPGQKIGLLTLLTLGSADQEHTAAWAELEAKWSEMNWIYEDRVYHSMIGELAELRPHRDTIMKLIEEHLVYWFSFIEGGELNDLLERKSNLYFWYQTTAWLEAFRRAVHKKTQQYPYSSDNIIVVMKAVRLIHESDDYDFNRDELAAKLLISGSYFSRCFKDIVGIAYSEYSKGLRLKKAVLLVESTNLPIYVIAEKTGFQDEKYFSRVFFKQFGRNPQEHRKQFGLRSGRV
ncbi:response regulator transcription factor [Paenibacillus montanisoli]|nr:response regulator [Paenibacillus montanisoli]